MASKKSNSFPTGENDNQENLNKFRIFIEIAPDAFIHGDKAGNILYVNNKAVELTAYSREELLKINIADLFPEGVLEEKPLRFDLLSEGEGIKNERQIKTKDGRIIHVETNSKALPDGTFQSFIRNITDRRKAGEKIRVSETRLRRAELASKSGNWELHLDTQMMIASDGATKIYGVDKDQMEFSVIKKVPLPEYRSMMDLALKELIEDNKPYDIEFKIKAVDTGQIKDIHSIAIFDREKRILFGIIQDITEQKKVRDELIYAKEKAEESDRLKTAFIQNLSHEVRTPLNAIIGFAELLKDTFGDLPTQEKYTRIICQRSWNLLDIINDILDYAMIESGQLYVSKVTLDIRILFKELSTFFSEYQERIERSTVSLKLEIDDSIEKNILADKIKLQQILINLISNALKFTAQGTVTLGYRSYNDQYLLFYVTDTGAGIPPEKHEVIFDRFVQLDPLATRNIGGNGLGLAIVKGLVNLLGGKISLKSVPGKGSTFSFTIPFETPLSEGKDDTFSEKKAFTHYPDKTVLIVEDDPYNSEYLENILQREGIRFLKTVNGKEAVELIAEQAIDLVLLDIRLPDISGYEVAGIMKKKKPELKIVAQTAYASLEDKHEAIKSGCDDYLSKPTKKDELLGMIQKYL